MNSANIPLRVRPASEPVSHILRHLILGAALGVTATMVLAFALAAGPLLGLARQLVTGAAG